MLSFICNACVYDINQCCDIYYSLGILTHTQTLVTHTHIHIRTSPRHTPTGIHRCSDKTKKKREKKQRDREKNEEWNKSSGFSYMDESTCGSIGSSEILGVVDETIVLEHVVAEKQQHQQQQITTTPPYSDNTLEKWVSNTLVWLTMAIRTKVIVRWQRTENVIHTTLFLFRKQCDELATTGDYTLDIRQHWVTVFAQQQKKQERRARVRRNEQHVMYTSRAYNSI